MLHQETIDVLCLSETFLSNDKTLPPIPDYVVYRQDRSFERSNKTKGGGVACIIHSICNSKLYTLKP